MNNKSIWTALVLGALVFPGELFAAETEAVNEIFRLGWLAFCCSLVLFMQPGFALVESGLSRAKNSINVIMKNFADICIGSLAFWALGYGLMFGTNSTGLFGTDQFFVQASDPGTMLDIVYQLLFAATAATIVSGAVAERIRFVPYLIGAATIMMVIYPIFGAWAWGGEGENQGWLAELGFFDAAGSTVVHSIGGWCALGAVLALGPRLGRFSRKGDAREIPGHNLPMFALGGFILWFGWFGFNGGAANDDLSNLGQILLNTQLGAASGVAAAMITMRMMKQQLLMTQMVNGGLGGLVSVTAGCSVMAPGFAVVTGLCGGALVVIGTTVLTRLRVDDVVGAIPVHGLCGAWGTIAAGMFVSGNLFSIGLIVPQVIGVIAGFIWALPLSYGVFKLLDVIIGLRASTQHEQRGMDFSEHNELGYGEFMTTTLHEAKG